jgi:hypothetical protein
VTNGQLARWFPLNGGIVHLDGMVGSNVVDLCPTSSLLANTAMLVATPSTGRADPITTTSRTVRVFECKVTVALKLGARAC